MSRETGFGVLLVAIVVALFVVLVVIGRRQDGRRCEALYSTAQTARDSLVITINTGCRPTTESRP